MGKQTQVFFNFYKEIFKNMVAYLKKVVQKGEETKKPKEDKMSNITLKYEFGGKGNFLKIQVKDTFPQHQVKENNLITYQKFS